MRVAENGGDLVPFQAPDTQQIRRIVVAQAHAHRFAVIHEPHQRPRLKAAVHFRNAAGQEALAVVSDRIRRARVEVQRPLRIGLIRQPVFTAGNRALFGPYPCADGFAREQARDDIRFAAGQDGGGHAELRHPVRGKQFGVHAARAHGGLAAAQGIEIEGPDIFDARP